MLFPALAFYKPSERRLEIIHAGYWHFTDAQALECIVKEVIANEPSISFSHIQ